MSLVDNIRAQAAAKGLTMAQLEERAGLPYCTVNRWDRNEPGYKKVAAVAAVLNISMDALIKG